MKNKILKNRRGWIKIVEAFTAVLLITGVLLIVFDRPSLNDENASQKVYDEEQRILLDVQLNESLREDILIHDSASLPIDMESFSQALKDKINSQVPSYLNCTGKICNLNSGCSLNISTDRDVYVQKVIISATPEKYSPRELNLFCWTK